VTVAPALPGGTTLSGRAPLDVAYAIPKVVERMLIDGSVDVQFVARGAIWRLTIKPNTSRGRHNCWTMTLDLAANPLSKTFPKESVRWGTSKGHIYHHFNFARDFSEWHPQTYVIEVQTVGDGSGDRVLSGFLGFKP